MEDFVPFEIAKKLKEKGFPQDIQHCIGWYPTEYYKNSCIGEYFEGELQEIEDYYGDRISAIHIIENEKKGVIAPTISQVLKWLREKYKVFILIEPDLKAPSYELVFSVRVKFFIKDEEDEGFREKYLTYRRKSHEQAAIAGICWTLDNLIGVWDLLL